MRVLPRTCRSHIVAAAVGLLGGCAQWNDDGVHLAYQLPELPRHDASGPAGGDATTSETVYRSQSGAPRSSAWPNEPTPGTDDTYRRPMAVSGIPSDTESMDEGEVQPAQFTSDVVNGGAQQLWADPANPSASAVSSARAGSNTSQAADNVWQPDVPRVAQVPGAAPESAVAPLPLNGVAPSGVLPAPSGTLPPVTGPGTVTSPMLGVPTPYADIFVNVQETTTGMLSIGAAVNSDAGLIGQIVIDEKNFDWRRVPTSWQDVINGTAFRGAGQGFRLEAMPGSQVQRYLVNFTEPYLGGTRISLNLSGYLYDRQYFDWDEQRLGGRIGMGYRITPDLSLAGDFTAQEVNVREPRVLGVPELDAALGTHELYSTQISLTQDTRDIPFAPTQGYYLELAFKQTFGSFDYPGGSIDFRRYFLVAERPDGSGRHVLGMSNRFAVTGSQTPVFENLFAGGASTLRGFDFRGASPQSGGVVVGGEFLMLGSVEYLFPITADDMLKGVAFVDYGTVEEEVEIEADDYRVSLGLGLRISIPAMGPAPIALDFAVPVHRENTDDIQNFSFFLGYSR